jgi:hypothetical protein
LTKALKNAVPQRCPVHNNIRRKSKKSLRLPSQNMCGKVLTQRLYVCVCVCVCARARLSRSLSLSLSLSLCVCVCSVPIEGVEIEPFVLIQFTNGQNRQVVFHFFFVSFYWALWAHTMYQRPDRQVLLFQTKPLYTYYLNPRTIYHLNPCTLYHLNPCTIYQWLSVFLYLSIYVSLYIYLSMFMHT